MKNLLNGDSTSCGCVKDHFAYKGLSKQHPALYKCWTNMRERCLNPGNDAYKFYGGKGITICSEWRDATTGFPAFVAWATSQGYEPGLQIDRIDPDAGYRPANCRWLTARDNIFLQHQRRTIHDISQEARSTWPLPAEPRSRSFHADLRSVWVYPAAPVRPTCRHSR